MFQIVRSDTFDRWLRGLRDRRAVARINARLRRVSLGHLGDVKPVGEGIWEMRIFHGPGYRLYFLRDGGTVIVLLCGGDKSQQQRDIALARRLARAWRERA